jgi:hypothetical protein
MLRKPGFAVHGTGETVKSVVVEQLPVVVAIAVVAGLLWAAFAGTIDKLAIATPATKSNAVFIAISYQIPRQLNAPRSVLRRGDHTADCVRPPSQNRSLPFLNQAAEDRNRPVPTLALNGHETLAVGALTRACYAHLSMVIIRHGRTIPW